MIDIALLRTDPEAVAENLARRGVAREAVEQLRKLDATWRDLTKTVEQLRAQQNATNEQIAGAQGEARETAIAQMREAAGALKAAEQELKQSAAEREAAWRQLPNLVAADVPDGGAGEFELVRESLQRVAEKNFALKDYFELGEGKLFNLADAARVSGSGFAYILGDLARLQIALVAWLFDELAKDRFLPVLPPVLVGEEAMAGMGYLDHQGDEIYQTQDALFLVGTSEQALGPLHTRKRYEVALLDAPKRYVGYSSCFRREAGSHGKNVRGLLRLHQFEKIEMFSFTAPEQSSEEHEFLLAKQEQIMQALELPYRVIVLAAGDLGAPAAKTYDIETWIPSEQRYVETHSTSNTTDYQARRLNIRAGTAGRTRYLHMLNGTALAMSRIFIALLENHQQADGSVAIPQALRAYVPFEKIAA